MIRSKLFWRGAILALILPLLAFIAFSTFYMDGDFYALYLHLDAMGVLTHVLSLCTLLNVVPFFLFLRSNRDEPANGVLMITILIALFIVVNKLLF